MDKYSFRLYIRLSEAIGMEDVKLRLSENTESQAVLDVHCSTTREGRDADLCEQLAPGSAPPVCNVDPVIESAQFNKICRPNEIGVR